MPPRSKKQKCNVVVVAGAGGSAGSAVPPPPAPPAQDVCCKFCKRRKSSLVPWRGADGNQCRVCPRIISASEHLRRENKADLSKRLAPDSTDLAEWLKGVEQWEAAHPYNPRTAAPAVGVEKVSSASAESIKGIFWPKWLYQQVEHKDPPKELLVDVEEDGVHHTGVWRTEPLDAFRPGAIVFKRGTQMNVKLKRELVDDGDSTEHAKLAFEAAVDKIDSAMKTKDGVAGSLLSIVYCL